MTPTGQLHRQIEKESWTQSGLQLAQSADSPQLLLETYQLKITHFQLDGSLTQGAHHWVRGQSPQEAPTAQWCRSPRQLLWQWRGRTWTTQTTRPYLLWDVVEAPLVRSWRSFSCFFFFHVFPTNHHYMFGSTGSVWHFSLPPDPTHDQVIIWQLSSFRSPECPEYTASD